MRSKTPEFFEVDHHQLEDIARRAQEVFDPKEAEVIAKVFASYEYLTHLIQEKNLSIGRLRKMLFGATTEKTEQVLGDPPAPPAASGENAADRESGPAKTNDKPPRKGHGRNAAEAYRGAERIPVPHECLQPGDACPACGQGTVYEKPPAVVVRITGQAPLKATRYDLQKLRCHLCGKVFTAQLPESAGHQKYDASSAILIGLLKYGSGLPFNRVEGLQRNLEIPLPASTQWDVLKAFAPGLKPVLAELIRQAAQGDVIYNDDTTIKILALMGENRPQSETDRERTGLFTSGIVATCAGYRIALFFSSAQHAGEDLADVLKHRAAELAAPIQMCDALSRNLPKELAVIVANCLAHARRKFVDASDNFPEACRTVLEAFRVIYHNDALAREQDLSAEERLQFHRTQSEPTMTELWDWVNRQLDEKRVEPNSSLGEALRYLKRHWVKLTRFLHIAGAPLDNNICERALKKAILHRKNSLFYRTQNGADMGDLWMSLIHTCELNHVNPQAYLTAVLGHPEEVAAHPELWLPWTYQTTLAHLTSAA